MPTGMLIAEDDRSVTIWTSWSITLSFVRSYRGTKGRWYAAARATGRATLVVGAQQIPVSTEPVTDAETVGAASQAFLGNMPPAPPYVLWSHRKRRRPRYASIRHEVPAEL